MNQHHFELLHETPSQTGGPYVHIGLLPKQAGIEVFAENFDNNLVKQQPAGEYIRIEGQVLDGLGLPLRDVLLEIWQADAQGIYPSAADPQADLADPCFQGWGRAGADFDTGIWHFDSLKPGAVAGRQGMRQAPHINVMVFARGINIGLHTRLYFEDEAEANAQDPILNSIEWAPRRQTLITKRQPGSSTTVYRFDIYIQGDRETVFFDI